MKTSRYNIFFDTSINETLVFNGMSKKFFSFSIENTPELRTILDFPDRYVNKEGYKDFLSVLNKNGFLIEDDVDELEQLRNLFEAYKETKVYSLMILTTYSCNFSCWYCVQKHKNKYLNVEIIENIKKHISKYIVENNIKAFQISWFGGEPLLNFGAIREICTFAQGFCNRNGISYSCGITTNGSLITSNMAIEMKKLGFKDFQITIDGTKEHHNRTRYNSSVQDSFTTILKNIKILAENIMEGAITIRFNYTHKNLDEIIVDQVDSVLFSVKDKVELLFRKVWQEPDTTELSTKLRSILRRFHQKGYKILHDYDSLKLTSCYVEQDHFHAVFPDGTIDRCSNRDMSETRGCLLENGDIMWKTIPKENEINIFNYPSDCLDCIYLPLCMGPCPVNRTTLIDKNRICCHYADRDQIFRDDIKNFVILNKQ